MLGIIITVIAAVAFGVLAWFAYNRWDLVGLSAGSCVASGFIGVVAVIMIIVAIVINAGAVSDIATNEQRYECLVYQLENDIYDNDNDLGKKELYDQIQEWNEDLASGKAMRHDPWWGIFWADYYDQFEFIKLK